MLKRRKYKQEEQQQLVPLINEIREDHPRMSARDMYLMLQPNTMGRDQFERFCLESGYRVKRLKNYRVTTNSLGVTRFPNMIKDIEVTRVNQVFVSDITYFEIGPRVYYLTLIMDLFNREIVGWSASDNLRTENTTLPALHKVIWERGKANLKGAIFHSDGGGQYYCNEFKQLTRTLGMVNSMTEERVYENSHAERLNGVIKNNYLYPYAPKDLKSLNKMLDKAVMMYNTEKPHRALGKSSPSNYLKNRIVDNENNSRSYLPLSSLHKNDYFKRKIINKTVNVI
jgi:putative transposase